MRYDHDECKALSFQRLTARLELVAIAFGRGVNRCFSDLALENGFRI